MTVEYLYTDSFNLHEASTFHIDELRKTLVGLTSSDEDLLKRTISQIVWHGVGNLLRRALSETEIEEIDSIIERACSQPAENNDFTSNVVACLRKFLRITKQPLSIGLGHGRFVKATTKVFTHRQITASQEKVIAKSDASARDKAIYSAIVAVEKFFFKSGVSGTNGSGSFVSFADVFCYGQRAGYMFIIENYENLDQYNAKKKCAEDFLKTHRDRTEYLIKEIKERNFWTAILREIQDSTRSISQADFVKYVTSYLHQIINVKRTPDLQDSDGSSETDDMAFSRGHCGDYVLKIPLRLRNGDVCFLGTLVTTLDPLDVELATDRKYSGLPKWDGLMHPWNRFELLRTISSGLGLFHLNQKLQKVAEDIQWKQIGLKTIHNIKTDIGSAQSNIQSYRSGEYRSELLDAALSTLEGTRSRAESVLLIDRKKQKPELRKFEIIELQSHLVELLRRLLEDAKYNSKITTADKLAYLQALVDESYSSWITCQGSERSVMVEESFRIGALELLKNCIENNDGGRSIRITIDYSSKDFVFLVVENRKPMPSQIVEYVLSSHNLSGSSLDIGYGIKLILDTAGLSRARYEVQLTEHNSTVSRIIIPTARN